MINIFKPNQVDSHPCANEQKRSCLKQFLNDAFTYKKCTLGNTIIPGRNVINTLICKFKISARVYFYKTLHMGSFVKIKPS